jgi:hypothetical protein
MFGLGTQEILLLGVMGVGMAVVAVILYRSGVAGPPKFPRDGEER